VEAAGRRAGRRRAGAQNLRRLGGGWYLRATRIACARRRAAHLRENRGRGKQSEAKSDYALSEHLGAFLGLWDKNAHTVDCVSQRFNVRADKWL
jgi:hypothetical protein